MNSKLSFFAFSGDLQKIIKSEIAYEWYLYHKSIFLTQKRFKIIQVKSHGDRPIVSHMVCIQTFLTLISTLDIHVRI